MLTICQNRLARMWFPSDAEIVFAGFPQHKLQQFTLRHGKLRDPTDIWYPQWQWQWSCAHSIYHDLWFSYYICTPYIHPHIYVYIYIYILWLVSGYQLQITKRNLFAQPSSFRSGLAAFSTNAPSSPQATNGRPRPMTVLWRQGFSHPPLFLVKTAPWASCLHETAPVVSWTCMTWCNNLK